MFESALLRRAWGPNRRITMAVIFFICTIVLSCVAITYATAQGVQPNPVTHISRDAHQAIIKSMEAQVSLLKWIGAAIVSSLAAAVGLLYRELVKANEISRGDLVQGIKRREEILEENQKAVNESKLALQTLSTNIERLLSK